MSYDEHLISMAGGDGELDLALIEKFEDQAENGAMRPEDRRDLQALLALVREQQAKLDRVRELHILHEDSGKCAECTVSPYSMHSVKWSCPTIVAIAATEARK